MKVKVVVGRLGVVLGVVLRDGGGPGLELPWTGGRAGGGGSGS